MLIDKFKAKITIVIEKGICNENQFQLEFLSELEKFQASFLELFQNWYTKAEQKRCKTKKQNEI